MTEIKSLKAYEAQIQKLLREKNLPSEKRAAGLLAEVRINHFMSNDGSPDYQGRSWAYRTWFGELLDSLNLSADDRTKLQGRLRFHTGNALREKVPAEELEAHGLKRVSPMQRGKANYEQRSTPHRILRSGQRLSSNEELEDVTEILEGLARRIDTNNADPRTIKRLKKVVHELGYVIQ